MIGKTAQKIAEKLDGFHPGVSIDALSLSNKKLKEMTVSLNLINA